MSGSFYGICWLCSLPALASIISLLVRQAQFLPTAMWTATALSLHLHNMPLGFSLAALSMAAIHGALGAMEWQKRKKEKTHAH